MVGLNIVVGRPRFVFLVMAPLLTVWVQIVQTTGEPVRAADNLLPLSVNCTSTGQLCSPPFNIAFQSPQFKAVQFTASPSHCSDIRVYFRVDSVLFETTNFLAAGQSSPLVSLGALSAGTHQLSIQAEGRVGGCNVGSLIAWGGSLRLSSVLTRSCFFFGCFTQDQKDALSLGANEMFVVAGATAAVGFGCSLAPEAVVTKICAVSAYGIAAAATLTGAVATLLSNDPADTNFRVVAKPVTRSLGIQPLSTAQGLTKDEAETLNRLLRNLEQAISFGQALSTTLNRATAARDAGDLFWQAKQTLAARSYTQQMADLLVKLPILLNAAQIALQTDSRFPTRSITLSDVLHFEKKVATNGLPAWLIASLHELGADATTQDLIRSALTTGDANVVAQLGAGKFPQMLTDATFVSTLGRLATNLRHFADSIDSFSVLCQDTKQLLSSRPVVADSLCKQLVDGTLHEESRDQALHRYISRVRDLRGEELPVTQADVLTLFATALLSDR